jgi:hypothetical protein
MDPFHHPRDPGIVVGRGCARMAPTICIVYRHTYGCPRGDCPSHIAVIRDRADADKAIRTLSKSHPESPVEIVRVSEV